MLSEVSSNIYLIHFFHTQQFPRALDFKGFRHPHLSLFLILSLSLWWIILKLPNRCGNCSAWFLYVLMQSFSDLIMGKEEERLDAYGMVLDLCCTWSLAPLRDITEWWWIAFAALHTRSDNLQPENQVRSLAGENSACIHNYSLIENPLIPVKMFKWVF